MKLAALNEHTTTARLRVDALEQELVAAYLKALRAAGRKAASRFRAAASPAAAMTAATDPKWLPPDPGALLDEQQLAAQAKKNAAPVQERALRLAVPVGISFDLADPLAQQFLAGLADRSNRVIGGFSDEIGAAIGEAHEEGLSVPKAAQLIRARVESASLVQATLLARSDLVSIANGGSLLAAQLVNAASAEAGEGAANFKTWLTAGDERVRETHADADAQTVPLDQPFDVGGESLMYPGDPDGSLEETLNCFPAGTLVGGAVVGAIRARYSGSLIKLTTHRGRILSGTPNHPILTTRGWIPLELIKQGDQVICARFDQRSVTGAADIDHVPARIEQVWDALGVSGMLERVPGIDVNFYGDRPEGDVDVVRADGFLELPGTPAFLKPSEQFTLAISDDGERSLSPDGLGGEFFRGGDLLPARAIGIRAERLAFLARHAAVSNLEGFGRSAARNPGFLESARDDGAADTELHGDLFFRHAIEIQPASRVVVHDGAVGALDGRGLAKMVTDGLPTDIEMFGDGCMRETGCVEVDDVLSIDSSSFQGDVFTLDTMQGYYIANGVVVRNCRCTQVYGDSMSASAVRAPVPALSSAGTMDETPEVTTLDPLKALEDKIISRDELLKAMDLDEKPAPLVLRDFHLTAAAGEPTRWQATLLVEDEPTEAGRMIAANGATWRPLPLPLSILDDSSHSDTGEAPVCGRIDQIWRAGSLIQAAGVFDSGPIGVEAERLVTERMITGISCDGICTASEIVVTRKDDAQEDSSLEDEVDQVVGGDPVVEETYEEDLEYLFVATEYVIMGATICPAGAIAQARIDVVTAAIGDDESWRIHGRFEPSRCEVEPQPAPAADTAALTASVKELEDTITRRFAAMEASQNQLRARFTIGRIEGDLASLRDQVPH